MGSYFKFADIEINSKVKSGITRNIIEDCFKNTNTEGLFDSYESNILCSQVYVLTQTGMARLLRFLNEDVMDNDRFDNEYIEKILNEYHPYHSFHGNKEKYQNSKRDDIKHELQWIRNLFISTLTKMIIYHDKKLSAYWL